ncbi:hypothetical protein [Haloferax sp. Atlit-12N]|uniref:hypothetical protein n=1 Tax=Haloferax sp. Atlit-12N TaxID=2077203 RepID=UPI001314AAC1|nr:hypothetical protein [Haloferax sp. Atlit-12N]
MSRGVEQALEKIRDGAWELGNYEDELPEDVFAYFEDEYCNIEDMVDKGLQEVRE